MREKRNTIRPFGLLFLLPIGVVPLVAAFTAEAPSRHPVSALVAARGPLAAASTPENIRLTESTSKYPEQEEPSIVVDGQGALVAGWKELPPNAGAGAVGFGVSLDGGHTWSRGLLPASSNKVQADPWLAVDGRDRIYYAFLQGPVPNRIGVSRSDARGGGWSPFTTVGGVDKPSIKAEEEGNVYIASVGQNGVVASRSSDGGTTWTGKTLGVGSSPWGPAVATSGKGLVSVAWVAGDDGNILNSASVDSGETWSDPVRVNPRLGSAPNNGEGVFPRRWPFPSAEADRKSIYVAWANHSIEGDWDVVTSRSDDNGATWSSPVRVNDVAAGDQFLVALALDPSGILHAAWYDMRSGNIDVYYANSSDRGEHWSPNLRITTEAMVPWDFATRTGAWRLSEYLGLAVDRNGVAYIVWTDWRTGARSIYFARTAGLPQGPADRLDPVPPGPRGGNPRVVTPRN